MNITDVKATVNNYTNYATLIGYIERANIEGDSVQVQKLLNILANNMITDLTTITDKLKLLGGQ